ncbi:hypothetical protein N3K66_006624 [Trichothecium roseum]|uniref:Uncharacterized protein n=1 Tax=Trichothecium roseum TaxID=47278 RepID=A0ACC0UVZ0_9HYPO|nr:hypothetical protein N3K66_006624 [Trichothecium roseum]
MPPKHPLEVAVFSASSALQAQRNGASRVELNAPGSYPDGGLTPPLSELTTLASPSAGLKIPVRVMIRPVGVQPGSGPDFVYSDDEFGIMKRSLREIKEAGVLDQARGDGFVFGILEDSRDGGIRVDVDRCAELVKLAAPYPCVFHRAFDVLAAGPSHAEALDSLVACGFRALLTSGGVGSHGEHLDRLEELIALADGRLQTIVGGGVRAGNVGAAIERLGRFGGDAVWFHTACLATGEHVAAESLDDVEMGKILSVLDESAPGA